MGLWKKFKSDFRTSMENTRDQTAAASESRRSRNRKPPGSARIAKSPSQIEYEVRSELTVRQPRADSPYAEPEHYAEMPVLSLRDWDFGKGLNSTSDGFAFTTPDGKIWTAGKCLPSLWKDLGVLAFNVVGEKFHAVDVRSPGFSPGRPVRLVMEPNNVHSKSGNAISVRDLSMTRRAGYVASSESSSLRKKLEEGPFYAMVLSADYEDAKRTKRSELKIVVFRRGRVTGFPEMEIHPPLSEIADHSKTV